MASPLLSDLQTLLEAESAIPLPRAHQVLYVGPLPDGARKNCANCCLYVKDETCSIHDPEIHVKPDAVCGYHVGGEPANKRRSNKVEYVDPDFSGLGVVQGGTSCDICKFYKSEGKDSGRCQAVIGEEGEQLLKVSARGCCARWEAKK
jgi:hypothetical protein